MTTRHRLLAILVADAVGYSRLMSADDVGTVAALDDARGVFARHVASQFGRIVDMAGDSVLAAFDTAGGAVLAALGIQQQLLAQASSLPASERMRFRIGLHLGDVIEKEDGTVYGDGVNIAARLQQLGPPEGVTVSQAIHDAVKNRIDATFEDLGEQAIKNMTHPIRAFCARVSSTAPSRAQAISAGGDARPSRSGTALTNLDFHLDPLIGRDADVAALRKLLEAHRLVTILGGGGIGKTRLAQATARELLGSHRDGVWWIDLAAVLAPGNIVGAIAHGTHLELDDVSNTEPLARALGQREVVLVLDNCEHLVADLAPIVQGALQAAPRLLVLATSQEPLKVRGEQVYRLDALAVPPASTALEEAREYGAVQLLERRAQAIDARFSLNEGTIAQAIELCRHLGGVALAIEMAAARLPLLGVQQVHSRLGERFRLLQSADRSGPARHQSLHATLDWSHSLLSDTQQAVLRRISVFASSFLLEPAQHVASSAQIDEWAVLDSLGELAEKSLLQVERVDPPRYRLLETLRLYATERLSQQGETAESWLRHGQAMARLAEEAERTFWITEDRRWWDRHSPDVDDFEEAFVQACKRKDPDTAMVVGEVLEHRHEVVRMLASRRRRVEASYPLLPLATGRAGALLWSWLALSWPVPVAGVSRLLAAREAVSAWRQLDDAPRLFLALGILAQQSAAAGEAAASRAALDEGRRREDPQWPPRLRHRFAYHASYTNCLLGDVEAYRAGVREELALAEAAGADHAASLARYRLADAALMAGDVEEATTLGYAVVEEQRTRFARARLGGALCNLCGALLMRGDLEAARMAAKEAWPEVVATGGFGYLLAHLALLAVRLERFEAAAQMLGRIDAWCEATQNSLESEARSAQLALEVMTAVLHAEQLAQLRAAGRSLSEEKTEALVQSVLERQPPAGPACE